MNGKGEGAVSAMQKILDEKHLRLYANSKEFAGLKNGQLHGEMAR